MAFSSERFLRRFVAYSAAVAISYGIIHCYNNFYHDSLVPKPIASSADDQYFYRLFASCGLYDVPLLNRNIRLPEGIRSIQLQGENQTVIAHTDNPDINMGIYPDIYPLRGLAEKIGYYRYKGVFGDNEITGGIFC